jgi:hypothetical protein
MADGTKKVMNTVRLFRSDPPDSLGGVKILDISNLPTKAVSFSLFLTRFSGQGTELSKISKIEVRYLEPGTDISP